MCKKVIHFEEKYDENLLAKITEPGDRVTVESPDGSRVNKYTVRNISGKRVVLQELTETTA